MAHKYSKCQKCPAFHLLSEEIMDKIERWEYKRDQYIQKMKNVRLILFGESLPANRYFYDLNTEYESEGLRYTLKKEFDKLELNDSLFLESFSKKGIILFDCALCPLFQLENNTQMRKAATHCFLSYNHAYLKDFPNTPVATIFPKHRGFLKTEIPTEILSRIKGEFGFSDQTGLRDLFEVIKKSTNDNQ